MKKNMPQLFNVDFVSPDEVKATKFISKLQSKGFVGRNKIYLTNYINADIGIAFSHIKTNYKRYVLEGGWSEEKFEDIIYIIANERQMLIPNVFLRFGIMYDDGKLTHKISQERRKYDEPEEEISDEDELLEYIRKHGGGE